MRVVYARLTGRLFAGLLQNLLLASGIRGVSSIPVELSDRQVEILSGRLLATRE